LPSHTVIASTAIAALAASVSRTDWRFVLHHDSPIHSATFSPDGSRIVIASTDGTTRIIWDVATGKQMKVLRGHDGINLVRSFQPRCVADVTASADKIEFLKGALQNVTRFEKHDYDLR
jgi:WD40 repeat protein